VFAFNRAARQKPNTENDQVPCCRRRILAAMRFTA